ncbi:MAG: phosphoribosyltransferase-like protein [Planctomycetota bacterium]
MRNALAERLLANVMNWSPADVARERPVLQALAELKYDEYQQFSPGMRFVESLALWLAQFTPEERRIAYDFIRSRLIFLSEAEMAHFAAVMYPDFLRPRLLERAAAADKASPFHVGRVARGDTFRRLEASTLYFGLSDGARIDQFRRSNRELSHEQIFPSYELSEDRVGELQGWLEQHGAGGSPVPAIVLIDDLSASGTSYLREEDGELKGKVAKFLRRITASAKWKDVVKFPDTSVVVALYVATAQALENIRAGAKKLEAEFRAQVEVVPVQILDERLRISASSTEPFVQLVEKYYDPAIEDEHTKKGGTNVKYGFSACGLPLVLHHNTPNNSLCLLWVENSEKVLPLFERFSRFRRDS